MVNLPTIASLRQKTNRTSNSNSTSNAVSDGLNGVTKAESHRNGSHMKAIHNSIINNRLQLSSQNYQPSQSVSVVSKVKCVHCNHEFPSKRLLQFHLNQKHPGLPREAHQFMPDAQSGGVMSSQFALNMVMKKEPK